MASELAETDELLGESRWPPIAALVAFMALNIALRAWLPANAGFHLDWFVPALEGVLLLVLLTANPSGAVERHRMRRVSVALVCLLVGAALWATGVLVADLIDAEGVSNSPSELLAAGGVTWLGNNLAFALLYWLMDGGGPHVRMRLNAPVDLAFTQQLNPELEQPGWRPVFADYMHLGFTNATAFSPTDVMPLSLRAKYAMLVQATVSLALFALVFARAVNAFS